MSKRLTLSTLRAMPAAGEPIAALTAYDYSFAVALDAAGVDLVLVGDSLGMVMQGHASTVPVSVADMAYHTRCVARGLERAYLVVDMPFLSDTDSQLALTNAAVLMKEGGADMVKVEASAAQAPIVAALSQAGVPVCAHFGLRPQRVGQLGGYRVQGRGDAAVTQLLEDADALQAAGADLLLVECLDAAVTAQIQARIDVPLIGIGAGADCDGQILVLQDMLGLTAGAVPTFSHNFLADGGSISQALSAYVQAVKTRQFPGAEHTFTQHG
jgi:3-methyl-2-oxobutanoate hydroxymethyltransferase